MGWQRHVGHGTVDKGHAGAENDSGQGLEAGEEGAVVLPERMTPSSQGGLPMFATPGLLYYLGPSPAL